MKKIAISSLVLSLSAIQSPALANTYNATTWQELATQLGEGYYNTVNMSPSSSTIKQGSDQDPITVGADSMEYGGVVTLGMQNGTLESSISTVNIWKYGYMIIDGGDSGGIIKSSASVNPISVSVTGGELTLLNVDLQNGISTADDSGSPTIHIGDTNKDNTTTRLSNNLNTITEGNFHLEGTNTTLIFDGGTIAKNAYLDIAGGTNAFKILNGEVTIAGDGNKKDDWKSAAIYLSGSSSSKLILDKMSHDSTAASNHGKLYQTGGILDLKNDTHLKIDTSITTDGSGSGTSTVNIGEENSNDTSSLSLKSGGSIIAAASGDVLNVNIGRSTRTGNTLHVEGGTLDKSATVTIYSGNTLDVSSGSATLNGTGTGIDTWEGIVNLSGSGHLIVDNLTHSTPDATDRANYSANGTYSQSGGTLELKDGADLTLIWEDNENGDSIANSITAGNVTFSGTGSTLEMRNGNSFTPDTLTLTAGNSLIINNSFAVINGENSTVEGNITFSSGSLMLDSVNTGGSNGIMYSQGQSGGTDDEFTFVSGVATFSANDTTLKAGSGSLMMSGFMSLSGSGALDISTGASFFSDVSLTLSSGTDFIVSGGTATLNGTGTGVDTWENALNVSGGNLTLDSIVHDTTDSTYNQTGGTLNLTNGSSLSVSSGSITGNGTTVNIGTVTSPNNTLTVSGTGTIDESATIVLNANNNLNISGGNVTLNQAGTGIDTLKGVVNMSAGILNADSITTDGGFTHTGGTVNVGSDIVSNLLGDSYADMHRLGVHNLMGGDITIRGSGKIILDIADTWANTNITNNGGSFTLDGFFHDTTTSGKYGQTTGNTILQNFSTLTTDLDISSNDLSDGSVIVKDSTMNISTVSGATVGSALVGNSSGVINKNGAGALSLTGINSGYYGRLNINTGAVDFIAYPGIKNPFISGITHLESASTINVNTNGNNVSSLSNNILGTGTVNKIGAGKYEIYAGSDGNVDYRLNVNEGTMSVVTDLSTETNFNAPVSVTSSNLTVSSGSTNFNDGLTLSHGYLGIFNRGFGVTGDLSVGSTVNTMNGAIAENTISGNLNIGTSGIAEFLIDISPSTENSDSYTINGAIIPTGTTGTIRISDFNLIGAPSDRKTVDLIIFDPSSGVNSGVDFTSTDKIVKSTASMYRLSSSPLQNGNYTLSWQGYNPEAFRGQVAIEAAYANQLATNNVLFDHIGVFSEQFITEEKQVTEANENILASDKYNKPDKNVWVESYGNIEDLHLSQDIDTQNNSWGGIIGVDFPLVALKDNWSFLPTAYVAYTGSHQSYSGVEMDQNGGQTGIIGTFYKGNFTTSLLGNVGAYSNKISVERTDDTINNWFWGVASKSSYDIELPNDLTLQPNMLVSYNAFGSQKWDSSYGNTSMTTNSLNGLNLAPGLSVILHKETGSLYATTQLAYNVTSGTKGSVGEVDLPEVKMDSTTFLCEFGGTKQIQDGLSLYGQVGFISGARSGVGFQGGLQWRF